MPAHAPSRAIIDLDAYAHNLREVRKRIPEACRILAVVKANAYGHGVVPIAQRAAAEDVAMLGVATIAEGVALREAGIEIPILVMMEPDGPSLSAAIDHDLRLTISDGAAAEEIGDLARKSNKVVPVHCKIDTGMGRQGFSCDKVVENLLFLSRISHIDIEGLSTHFHTAESTQEIHTNEQLHLFRQALRQIERDGIPFEITHASNSAAVINYPMASFDMVRPGIMTYGVWPPTDTNEASTLRPVLRWETNVRLVRSLKAGTTIGYGHSYEVAEDMRVALLPVGYGDGYPYSLGNRGDVLIHGQRCPIRGSVCMDLIVVDVTALPSVSVGDTAVLIGTDGAEAISVDHLAERSGTITYDLLTGIGNRVERIHIN
jgi:alanine racemase